MCLCVYELKVCHSIMVSFTYIFASQFSLEAAFKLLTGHIWHSKRESRCSLVNVCVCRGWGCCHFGNATAHIAAITTAEKCFSATCNYYRLQIAVLASEALARKGEASAFVCMCAVTHK